jgi:hypothetical protein
MEALPGIHKIHQLDNLSFWLQIQHFKSDMFWLSLGTTSIVPDFKDLVNQELKYIIPNKAQSGKPLKGKSRNEGSF